MVGRTRLIGAAVLAASLSAAPTAARAQEATQDRRFLFSISTTRIVPSSDSASRRLLLTG